VDFSKETFDRTTIGKLKNGDKVNLERALKADSRLGGHMVTGHVEAVGRLVSITGMGNSKKFEFSCPSEFEKFVVEKGSIAVDGVSLTVTDISRINSREFKFGIAVIPYTLKSTTLGLKKNGSLFNIETDILAKYAVKNNSKQSNSEITYDLLERKGFLK
jgi:riboflavin synthase